MKKQILYIFGLLIMLLSGGCGMEENYLPVGFEAVNCTCKLTPEKVTPLVMFSEAEWLQKFNPAGASVDFGKKFLISVCGPSTDVMTCIKIKEILNKEQSLYVKYVIEKGEKISYKMLPHATVAVDRGYMGCDIGFFDITGMD